MKYVNVFVPKRGIFTYTCGGKDTVGDIVTIKIRSKQFKGIILEEVDKPSFSTKPIDENTNEKIPDYIIKLGNWIHKQYGANREKSLQLVTQHWLT
ncbi:hypothetical protein ACFL56_02685 [Candidatus Margulisiibacteriota bacterium]